MTERGGVDGDGGWRGVCMCVWKEGRGGWGGQPSDATVTMPFT